MATDNRTKSKRLASGDYGFIGTTDPQVGITAASKTYISLKEQNDVPYSEAYPATAKNQLEDIKDGHIPYGFYDNSEDNIPTPNAEHSYPEMDSDYGYSGDTDMHWNQPKPEWHEFKDSINNEEEPAEDCVTVSEEIQ